VSIASVDSSDPDQLMKNADMALYRAKADGRGTYRFFEPRWTPAPGHADYSSLSCKLH
jgi:predicted signal transduction protein with EAL and GGDEF domain